MSTTTNAPVDNAPSSPLVRQVGCHLESQVVEVAEIVLSVVVSGDQGGNRDEQISITVDGAPINYEEVHSTYGTRLLMLRDVPVGKLVVDYSAKVSHDVPFADEPLEAQVADRILYLRPSRYCESDTLAAVAAAEFTGLQGKALLDAVSSWVGQRLAYVSGWSRPTDGAVHTYLDRRGVCRDFAHLVIAMLRARGVPARLAAVYAPGLSPMDFHAVAEAQLDGVWYVVDATALAPRQGLLRISTGRDASDTAFMTVHSGVANLSVIEVTATMAPELPADDMTALVRLP